MATDTRSAHLSAQSKEIGVFASAYFRRDAVPLRSSAPRRRRSSPGREVAIASLAALAATIAVLVIVLSLLQLTSAVPAPRRAARPIPTGSTTADLAVERVRGRLTDGREVLGSFVIRFRESAAPTELVTAARATPTPRADEAPRGVKTPVPPTPGEAESRVRGQVNGLLNSVGYDEIAGEAGKARLRSEVRDAVNDVLPGKPVTDVFIRDLIVK